MRPRSPSAIPAPAIQVRPKPNKTLNNPKSTQADPPRAFSCRAKSQIFNRPVQEFRTRASPRPILFGVPFAIWDVSRDIQGEYYGKKRTSPGSRKAVFGSDAALPLSLKFHLRNTERFRTWVRELKPVSLSSEGNRRCKQRLITAPMLPVEVLCQEFPSPLGPTDPRTSAAHGETSSTSVFKV